MSLVFVIAQILGVIIFIINVYGETKLTTSNVAFYNGLANGLSSIQYFLLGAYSGALCCLIATIRNIVYERYKKKIPLSILLIYIAIVILLNYKLIYSALDIIPIVNIILFAITLWTKDIYNIKVFGILSCIDGSVYNYRKGAYTSILSDIIIGIIGINCLFRLNKKKKSQQ